MRESPRYETAERLGLAPRSGFVQPIGQADPLRPAASAGGLPQTLERKAHSLRARNQAFAMFSPSTLGAVIYVKDLERLTKFYRQVVGLEVAHTESTFVVLESPIFQLVLHSIPAAVATSINISSPPIRREDTAVKLVLPVSSIKSARTEALALGGEVNPPEREWQFQGCLVCDGHDPEGNVIQFRENRNAL